MAATPWRDLLRGRLTCRHDTERAIAAAALPAPLVECIRQVVRCTRLWRSEKAELAAELIAHFADGIGAGRAPEELLQSFGDPRQAAALIRRAKKRARPWPWRALRRGLQAFGVLLALLGVCYGVLAARFYAGSPTITHNYTAELNAPLASIPEDQKAWPLYWRAALALPHFPEELFDVWLDARPGERGWEESLRYNEACHQSLDLIRQASRRPVLGKPLSTDADEELENHLREILRPSQTPPAPVTRPPSPSQSSPAAGSKTPAGAVADLSGGDNPVVASVVIEEFGLLRRFAHHLGLDARAAVQTGDAARAFDDDEAILAIANHASQGRFLISQACGFGILTFGLQSVGETLDEHPALFSDQQLVDLAHTIGAWGGGGTLANSFDGERLMFEDFLQRTYSDDGHGDGRFTPEGARLLRALAPMSGDPHMVDTAAAAGDPIDAAILLSRAELRAAYTRVIDSSIAEARIPLWQRTGAPARQRYDELTRSVLDRSRYLPVAILIPPLDQLNVTAEQTTQLRDATLVVIALELFHRRHGRYPATLDELVPSFLPAVPPDRFDGRPIRYRLRDGRPVIYSVGSDLKDDGGRPPRTSASAASHWYPPRERQAKAALQNDPHPIPDGDWVFWPSVRYDRVTGDLIDAPAAPPN